MRSPVRPLPPHVERWASCAHWLGWLEALAAWIGAWGLMALALGDAPPSASAFVALVLLGLAMLAGPLRRRWRPVRALVTLSVSRRLRPGDRAWLVLPGHVEGVVVTARRRGRLVVAQPGQSPSEGLDVRRTRVLVVPNDSR
jgi:hypothetical protein